MIGSVRFRNFVTSLLVAAVAVVSAAASACSPISPSVSKFGNTGIDSSIDLGDPFSKSLDEGHLPSSAGSQGTTVEVIDQMEATSVGAGAVAELSQSDLFELKTRSESAFYTNTQCRAFSQSLALAQIRITLETSNLDITDRMKLQASLDADVSSCGGGFTRKCDGDYRIRLSSENLRSDEVSSLLEAISKVRVRFE
jgi:hypothetical protein